MPFIKCHCNKTGEVLYINLDNVAEIELTSYGCSIAYTTSNSDGDQVYRWVSDSIEDILRQIPE